VGYRVQYTARALKQLKKMDRFDATLITSWIGKNLESTDDPRRLGKALVGDRSGEWRYRVGDYRILCRIQDDVLLIEVFLIGHRRDIYKKK
jgi:addiction module toxin, RelE/StbE family